MMSRKEGRQAANIDIEGCVFRSNGKREIYIRNAHNVKVQGAVSYHSNKPFALAGDVKNIRLIGSRF